MNELLPGTAGYNRSHQQTLSHVPERCRDKAQKAGGVRVGREEQRRRIDKAKARKME
jgi:hypothetical protein